MLARCHLLLLTLGLALGLVPLMTRAAETNVPASPSKVQLPLEFRRGSALVKASVNGTPLAFKLDTGFGVTTIHPDLADPLGLKASGKLTINGIAGHEEADWLSGAVFDFGGLKFAPRRVVRIPSDAQRPRRARDGILGAGFFRRFVVALDGPAKTVTLYEPEAFQYDGPGEVLPLEFRRETPTIEALINVPNGPAIRARYEIDSGCDGALCLGHDFVKSNRLETIASGGQASARSGVGGSVATHESRLPEFQLGSQKLKNVEANFFQEGSPTDDDLAGHIGMGVLREFRVIFDYSRKRLILEGMRD